MKTTVELINGSWTVRLDNEEHTVIASYREEQEARRAAEEIAMVDPGAFSGPGVTYVTAKLEV